MEECKILGMIAVFLIIGVLFVIAEMYLINHGGEINREELVVGILLVLSISYSLMATYIIHIFGYI